MSSGRTAHLSRQTEAGSSSAPRAEVLVALWDAHTGPLPASFNAAEFHPEPPAGRLPTSLHDGTDLVRTTDGSIAEKGRELDGRFAGQLFRKEVAGADAAAPNIVGPLAPERQWSAGIGVPGA